MKVAISVSARKGEPVFEPRFGRAPAFAIIETGSRAQEIIDNPAIRLGSGAGIRAAELLVRHGVDAVISGAFGPKAYDVLQAAGTHLYTAKSGTMPGLIDSLLNGDLEEEG